MATTEAAAVQHTILELDKKGLRDFGLVTGGILAALFGLFFPWVFERPIPTWPWIIAGVLAAWALVLPLSLRPVYRIWMRLSIVLSRITTPIVMGVVFFLVVTPVSLIMRAIGRDALARTLDPEATTYRVPMKQRAKEHMERPF